MFTPESENPAPYSRLQTNVEELLEGVHESVGNIYTDMHPPDEEIVRLLKPNFPQIEPRQFTRLFYQELLYQRRSSRMASLTSQILGGLFDVHTANPSVRFSRDFTTAQRVLRGTVQVKNLGDVMGVEISETNYRGTITVDKQAFEFKEGEPVIRIEALESRDRVSPMIKYTYVPHMGYLESTPLQAEVQHPYLDTHVSMEENALSIIEAARRIRRT